MTLKVVYSHMNYLYPSYAEITDFCVRRADLLRGHIDAVLGITRGGLIPAVILSQQLEVPLIPISYSSSEGKGEYKGYKNSLPFVEARRILVVDDICDSGHTMKEVYDHYVPRNEKVMTLALYYKESSCYKPDYYQWYLTQDSGWVVFPWEKSPQ